MEKKYFSEIIFKKGSIVWMENSRAIPSFFIVKKGDSFYFIEKGKVKISHTEKNNEYIIALLRENEFFREMAILNQDLRNANAIVFEDFKL